MENGCRGVMLRGVCMVGMTPLAELHWGLFATVFMVNIHTKRLFACAFRGLNVKRQHNQQQRK
jgi:hypothetical protein